MVGRRLWWPSNYTDVPGCGNASFKRCHFAPKPKVYQDRLGTNIGNLDKKDVFALCRASPLERAYTQFGPTDAANEVLHLNRFHDTAWCPVEVRQRDRRDFVHSGLLEFKTGAILPRCSIFSITCRRFGVNTSGTLLSRSHGGNQAWAGDGSAR
jgi:hypothetical protein